MGGGSSWLLQVLANELGGVRSQVESRRFGRAGRLEGAESLFPGVKIVNATVYEARWEG